MDEPKDQTGNIDGEQRSSWIPVDMVIGVIFSIVLVLVVVLAGIAMASTPPPPPTSITFPIVDEDLIDLDARDPSVICPWRIEDTRCFREPR